MPRPFRPRAPVPDDPSIGSALHDTASLLERRQEGSSSGPGSSGNITAGSGSSSSSDSGDGINNIAIIIAAVLVGVVAIVCLYLFLRIVRSRNAEPKFLPKPLRKLWSKWDVTPHRSKTKYSRTGDTDDDRFHRGVRMREVQGNLEDSLQNVQAQQAQQAQQAAVNRNASVRSVMTLPAYRPKATDTEQVLGREGERDGIDTVVELPTAEEDEAMREEEMEALYQIRVARRRQIAEREERRNERRDARERNDSQALHDIRNRARIASEQAQREVDGLRAEHDHVRSQRMRAVSSVSYADVGLVRADGTRLRANSGESERMGLLSDAASIALSAQERRESLQHRRAPSGQSVLSIDTFRSNNDGSGGPRVESPGVGSGRSRASSRAQMSEVIVPRAGSASSQRAGSTPELIDAAEADIGENNMPPQSPPGYDDVSLEEITPSGSQDSGRASPYNEPPPDYSAGPTQARRNRLSAQIAEMVAEQQVTRPEEAPAPPERTSTRGVGGIPQLPSLRLNRLPQIVIEPSSAVPREDDIAEEERGR